jgi:hypothetical protein
VLDDLAVLETGNIEHIDLERLPGGREAHDRARVDAASLVERPDGVTVRGDLGCAVFSASLSARKHRANSGMDPQVGSNRGEQRRIRGPGIVRFPDEIGPPRTTANALTQT